ncbi:MAG TPA: nucleotidyltransferase family protein [Methylomirabilota bacterium]|nr:nucleotidyltransferase family protein [Methylomirabilota bacterium]
MTHGAISNPAGAGVFRLAAVVLGAGLSTRMGKPKLLLPWRGRTILGHLLHQWTELGSGQLAVVCAPAPCAVQEELDRLGVPATERILNPEPARGMFSSIRCAAVWPGWRPEISHWALILGDQPHLRVTTLQKLIGHAREHSECICQPTHSGRPRHPVVLPHRFFRRLAQAGEAHLKEFLERHRDAVSLCRVDDPGLDLDVDEPGDYEHALRTFGGQEAVP